MSFVTQRIAVTRVPLNGPKGEEWATVLGGAQDQELAVLRVAGIARSLTKAPDDALDDIGAAFSLPRAPREAPVGGVDSGQYRTRLAGGRSAEGPTFPGAWGFWQEAPLVSGITSIFDVYADQSRTATIPPRPAQVVQSNPVGWFSEFTVVWPSELVADDNWDAPFDLDGNEALYDDGGLWDIEYTPDNPTQDGSFGVADLDWIKRQLRAAKGAQAYPTVLSIALDRFDAEGFTALWDDGGTWDDGGIWDDPSASTFLAMIPLGRTWGDEAIYGGGPGVYDDGGTWDDGVLDGLVAPSGGW